MPVSQWRNIFRTFAAHHYTIWITYVGSRRISPISLQSHLFMLSHQFVLTKVTVYCMVCQTAHWSNYSVCRMPVLDWYLLRVDCHITPLLIKLHWLTIHSRIVFKILLLNFKILHGAALTYLVSLISLKAQSCYNLRRSSDTLLLKQPLFISKATLGDRSFTWVASKLWNALPIEVRDSKTLDTFRSKLKTHLFRLAFLS